MITLFTIPKAFTGNFDLLQRNAIKSWTLLKPECEIILLGGDEGVAQVAAELGVRHIPDIRRNEHGTPLLNSAFEIARKAACNKIICYVNADIILMGDFMEAVKKITFEHFLMVGMRWDLKIEKPLNFTDPRWESQLVEAARLNGTPQDCIDYFVFPKDDMGEIPPFAIGRTAWDNWLVFRGRSLDIPVVDAGGVMVAVHQNHDYSHSKKGFTGVWKGEETRENLRLAGRYWHLMHILDSTHILTKEGLKPRPFHQRLMRSIKSLPKRLLVKDAVDLWTPEGLSPNYITFSLKHFFKIN